MRIWPDSSSDRAVSRPYQTIGYIERGEYSPSLNLALRIARFFDLPVGAIFATEPFGQLGAGALLARPGEPPAHD